MIVDNLVISQLFWSLVHIVADLLRQTRACSIKAPPNLSTDKSTCLIIFLQFSADLCDSRALWSNVAWPSSFEIFTNLPIEEERKRESKLAVLGMAH